MGGDMYLREGDEGDLHRHAIDNILLATITQLIANTPNPPATLDNIKAVALGLSANGHHSPDPKVNDYARRYATTITEDFLNKIKISESS